jgi:hypothetical protein
MVLVLVLVLVMVLEMVLEMATVVWTGRGNRETRGSRKAGRSRSGAAGRLVSKGMAGKRHPPPCLGDRYAGRLARSAMGRQSFHLPQRPVAICRSVVPVFVVCMEQHATSWGGADGEG